MDGASHGVKGDCSFPVSNASLLSGSSSYTCFSELNFSHNLIKPWLAIGITYAYLSCCCMFAKFVDAIDWSEVFFTYFACLLTPIQILVQQNADKENALYLVLLVCDVYFAIKFCKCGSIIYFGRKERQRKATKDEVSVYGENYCGNNEPTLSDRSSCNTYQLAEAAFIASPLVLLPVLRYLLLSMNLNSSCIVWIGIFRMYNIRTFSIQFDKFKLHFHEVYISISTTLTRIILSVIFFTLLSSFLACLWYFIASISPTDTVTWVTEDVVINIDDIYSIYFRSLHFILQSLFTIGYGDILPINSVEICLTFFFLLGGILISSFLIAAMGSLISNNNLKLKDFYNDTSIIRNYLLSSGVQKREVESLLKYHDYLYSRQYGLTSQEIFDNLPRGLRNVIKRRITYEGLKRVPFFALQCDTFVNMCVDKMEFYTYKSGMVVFDQGSKALSNQNLVLVRSGKIEISSNISGKAIGMAVSGDSIGDYNMLFSVPPGQTMTCATYTEIALLRFNAFMEIVKFFELKNKTIAAYSGQNFQQCVKFLMKNEKDFCQNKCSSSFCIYHDSLLATLLKHKDTQLKLSKSQETVDKNLSRGNKIAEMMMKSVRIEQSEFYLLPDSTFMLLWSLLVLFMIIYYQFATPIHILATGELNTVHSFQFTYSFACNLVFDFLWLCDTVIRCFFLAYRRFEGEL